MSEPLFGRSAILSVIAPDGREKRFSGIGDLARSRIVYENGKPRLVDEVKGADPFHITFTVEQTSESNANTATISVYNINADSRQFVSQDKLIIALFAGYGPTPELLFQGTSDDDKTVVAREGADILTSFQVGDGRTEMKNAIVNKSFASGVGLRQIINTAVEALGLGTDPKISDLTDESFENGITMSGSAKEILDKYVKKQGLEWSIQNGVLEIKRPTSSVTDETVVLENLFLTGGNVQGREFTQFLSGTGLIGIPEKREKCGIQFTALLNPKIRPGRIVQIKTNRPGFEFDGSFVIRKAQHSGDNYRGPWYTTAEGVSQ